MHIMSNYHVFSLNKNLCFKEGLKNKKKIKQNEFKMHIVEWYQQKQQ